MLKNIAIFISVLPLIILIFLIGKFSVNNLLNKCNNKEIINLFGIIFSTISVQFIKKIKWPEYLHRFTIRPKGACDCDYLSIKGLCPDNTPGFPSGHMSTTSYFVVNNILNLLSGENKYENKHKKLYIIVNILFLLSMGWARMYKKCHSLLQVIAGTLYGGSISYFINTR